MLLMLSINRSSGICRSLVLHPLQSGIHATQQLCELLQGSCLLLSRIGALRGFFVIFAVVFFVVSINICGLSQAQRSSQTQGSKE